VADGDLDGHGVGAQPPADYIGAFAVTAGLGAQELVAAFKAKHDDVDVPNLEVIKLMQSLESKKFVRTTFSWQWYYWYLTPEGIDYLRKYLNLPAEVIPETLKKAAVTRTSGFGRDGERERGDRPERRREGGADGGYRSRREGGWGRTAAGAPAAAPATA